LDSLSGKTEVAVQADGSGGDCALDSWNHEHYGGERPCRVCQFDDGIGARKIAVDDSDGFLTYSGSDSLGSRAIPVDSVDGVTSEWTGSVSGIAMTAKSQFSIFYYLLTILCKRTADSLIYVPWPLSHDQFG
jgi:hypothetical protein